MSTSLEPGPSQHFGLLRRLYLYLVALICIVALQEYFRALATDVVAYWGLLDGNYVVPTFEPINRRMLEKGSYLLATSFCLVIHYSLILGWVRRDPQELESPLRKLFLFLSTAVALGYCVPLIGSLLHPALDMIWGTPMEASGLYWPHFAALILPLCLSGAIFIQCSRLLYTERGYGQGNTYVQVQEAVFFAVVHLYAILWLPSVIQTGLVQILLPFLLNRAPLLHVSLVPLSVPTSIAAAMTLVLLWHQVAGWRSSFRQGWAHVWGDVLHITVLQLGLLMGLIIFLAGLLQILQNLLGLLDGSSFQGFDLWPQLSPSLMGTLPLGVGYWLWFRHNLSKAPEKALLGRWRDVPRQLYLYSGIAVSVYLVGAGSHELILYFFGHGGDEAAPLTHLALGVVEEIHQSFEWSDLAPLLVGFPALYLLLQQISRLNHVHEPSSARSLRLLPRRLYLYGVTIVSTLSLLLICGRVLQALLRHWTGLDSLDVFSTRDFGNDAALLVVMVVILTVHVYLLRQPQGPNPAEATQVNFAAGSLREELASAYKQRQQVMDRIEKLESELAELAATEVKERKEP